MSHFEHPLSFPPLLGTLRTTRQWSVSVCTLREELPSVGRIAAYSRGMCSLLAILLNAGNIVATLALPAGITHSRTMLPQVAIARPVSERVSNMLAGA